MRRVRLRKVVQDHTANNDGTRDENLSFLTPKFTVFQDCLNSLHQEKELATILHVTVTKKKEWNVKVKIFSGLKS